MNKLQKLLCIGAGALALSSCLETEYEIGTVIDEKEIAPYMIFNPDTETKIILKDEKYLIKVQTEKGIYTLDVKDNSSYSRSNESKTIEALAWAIEIGDKIKFPVGVTGPDSTSSKNNFGDDKIGIINSSDIEVIKK